MPPKYDIFQENEQDPQQVSQELADRLEPFLLLDEADKEVKRLREQGKRVLCLWAGSVLEKPESRTLEG